MMVKCTNTEFNSFSSEMKTPSRTQAEKPSVCNGNGICLVFSEAKKKSISISASACSALPKSMLKDKEAKSKDDEKKETNTCKKNYRNACVFLCCLRTNGNVTVWHGKCAMEVKITKYTTFAWNKWNKFIKFKDPQCVLVCLSRLSPVCLSKCICADTINTKQFVFHFNLLFFTKHEFTDKMRSRFIVSFPRKNVLYSHVLKINEPSSAFKNVLTIHKPTQWSVHWVFF